MKIWKIFACIVAVSVIAYTFVLPHWNLPDVDAGKGDGSVQVYYVNLDKAEERRKAIVPQLEQLGIPYKQVSAVYGKELPEAEKDKLVNKTIFKLMMRREVLDGEIGCYLSHLKVWKEFLKSKASYALIFEDDASFDPSEMRKVVNELIANNDKWDYVNLDPNRWNKGRVVKILSDKFSLRAPTYVVWKNTGQLINRKAAASLIKHALPIRMAVDVYVHRTWELGYKYRIVAPPVVRHDFGGSYIDDGSNSYSNKWYLRVTNRVYEVLSHFMCYIMAYLR